MAHLAGAWKLAFLSAPAGYGKTTLAGQVARGRDGLWCRLHAEDRDPAHLLGSLISAAGSLRPPIGSRTRRLFLSLRSMERDGGLVTTSFLQELVPPRGERLVVLDDVHVIAESPEAVQWMRLLIEDSGPRVRFLLTGRGDCPIPLARVEMEGGVVRLQAEDLAFTEAEQRRLLRDAFQIRLSPGEGVAMNEILGGWAAGLVLAAQHLRTTGRPPATILSRSEAGTAGLVSFLGAEVYTPLPDRLRRCLRRVSALEDLDPKSVRRLVGTRDAAYLLREVSRRDLFVRTLPDGAGQARFHPLFREFLRERFDTEDPVSFRRNLLRRHARYEVGRGQTASAIRSLLDAGETDPALDLFERVAGSSPARRERDPSLGPLALHLLTGEPTSLRATTSPWVLCHAALQEGKAGNWSKAIRWIRLAEDEWLARRNYLLVGHGVGVEAAAASLSGQIKSSLARFRRLMNLLPSSARVAAGLIMLHAAQLSLLAGQPRAVRRMLSRSERLLRGSGRKIELAELSLHRGTIAFTEGRWDRYLIHARRSLDVFRRAGFHGKVQSLLINIAEACTYLGEEDQALGYLDEAAALHPRTNNPAFLALAAVGRARALSEKRDFDEAARGFRQARDHVARAGLPMASLQLDIWEGVFERRRGEWKQALHLLARAVEGLDWESVPSWLNLARMERALVLGARRSFDRSLGDLSECALISRRLGDRKELARNLLFEARILQMAGRPFSGALLRALRLLEREDYLVLLRKEADVSVPLLGALDTARPLRLRDRALAALPAPLGAKAEGAEAGRRRGPKPRTASAPDRVRIDLLGGFAVRAGARVAVFPRRASEAIVARLALHPGRSVSRDALAEALWPGASPEASRNRFDVALNAARRALEPDAGPRGPFRVLITEAGWCRLAPECIETDLMEFRRLSRDCEPFVRTILSRRTHKTADPEVRAGNRRALAALKAAVGLYKGHLLHGLSNVEWAEGPRERIRDRYHRLLMGLGLLYLPGSPDAAAGAARRILAQDPLHEEAERLLLRALFRRGERASAAAAYRDFARRMRREIGTPPDPETTALYQELLGAPSGGLRPGSLEGLRPVRHGLGIF
jgi:DNA-binding SARP family transcriptional activator/tetratricopeptide (TPR) repeat protein